MVRFDHLYLGGGNARDITLSLPDNVTIVPNSDGLTGGIRLWQPIAPHIAAGTGVVGEPGGPVDAKTAAADPAPPAAEESGDHDQSAADTPRPAEDGGDTGRSPA